MTSWRERLVEWGYAAGWRGVRALPLPAARALFNAGADRSHRGNGPGVRRLADNLRRVVGPDLPEAEFDALVRAAMRSYARYWMEAFRLPSLSPEQIVRGFTLENESVLAAEVAAGRGVVVALPHAGNWDAAGAWVAAKGWPIVTVAQRLKPEGLFARFVAFRERLGMQILPLTGGPRAPLDVLAEKTLQGYVVPLLADRDLSARGVQVRFFGGRTRMPAGPALLALRTGAPLYTVDMWFCDDAPHAFLRGPIDVPDAAHGPLDARVRILTQRVADSLAQGIARHPQDWHMLQRLWLDADDGDPRSSSASPAPSPPAPSPPAPSADIPGAPTGRI